MKGCQDETVEFEVFLQVRGGERENQSCRLFNLGSSPASPNGALRAPNRYLEQFTPAGWKTREPQCHRHDELGRSTKSRKIRDSPPILPPRSRDGRMVLCGVIRWPAWGQPSRMRVHISPAFDSGTSRCTCHDARPLKTLAAICGKIHAMAAFVIRPQPLTAAASKFLSRRAGGFVLAFIHEKKTQPCIPLPKVVGFGRALHPLIDFLTLRLTHRLLLLENSRLRDPGPVAAG